MNLAEMQLYVCVSLYSYVVLEREVKKKARFIFVSFMAIVKLQDYLGRLPTHLYSRCYHGETYGWYPGNQTGGLGAGDDCCMRVMDRLRESEKIE